VQCSRRAPALGPAERSHHPHVAGSTPASAIAAARFVREQAERFRDGRPLANVITGDY
jgi:phosphoglycerate dehydrogenase-like enzyme